MRSQHIDKLTLLPAQTPDSFQNRQVSFARPILFQTLPSTYPNTPIRSDASRERVDQSGLADACFSCDKYDLTLSSKHLLEPAFHPRQCVVALDNSLRRICGTPGCPLIFCRHLPGLRDRTDEAITTTMCGFNEARSLRIIAESL